MHRVPDHTRNEELVNFPVRPIFDKIFPEPSAGVDVFAKQTLPVSSSAYFAISRKSPVDQIRLVLVREHKFEGYAGRNVTSKLDRFGTGELGDDFLRSPL